MERATGWPVLTLRSRDGYDDHYMLAEHIVCRVTLSPVPRDATRYFVSHVL